MLEDIEEIIEESPVLVLSLIGGLIIFGVLGTMGWNHFIGNTAPAPTPQIIYVTPAPAPTKTATPSPAPTVKAFPDGVSIGPVNLGHGQFTAAIIDPAKWIAGGGKIVLRTWGDSEALYTVMLRNGKGELEYSSQCMYNLKDNTLVSVTDDPFRTLTK